ncbi:putative RDD family membrane protein YckC [Actinoplanes tereljensis]|uniref:RDD domain-containing protein n=1 Tax=Paractinoplanes tereljensis TaxID=571912 RepID=A0A919NZR1_9ACTN|nr:RDD family protein [Actinoplanes tereljensis]GIF26921.1 hypothetical protein Ate02nite_96510 [Actinoplanes tereljensis]
MTLNVHVTGRRIVATLLDGVLFGFVASALDVQQDNATYQLSGVSTAHGFWFVTFVFLYYVLLEGLTGRTVGKLITGIRVVDAETGRRPGLLSGFVRTLLRIIDGFAGYLLALIVVINSKNRRRLGDMAAKTLVVRS